LYPKSNLSPAELLFVPYLFLFLKIYFFGTANLKYIRYTKVSTNPKYSTVLRDSKLKGMEKTNTENNRTQGDCLKMILPVRDALDVLNGKWKLPILISLSFGNKRFKQIAREIPNITDKMLSKELRELEMNQLIKRTVYDSVPVIVEYSMTSYGKSLEKVIEELRKWGMQHRKRILGKSK
jgi:DNA-binding HxlR family transcriptional regulator